MNEIYVYDACALLAIFNNEKGRDVVEGLLRKESITNSIHSINLLEVYYGIYRYEGKEKANSILTKTKNSPLKIIDRIEQETFFEAGRLKATYRISLADAIAVAESRIHDATLVTADHHEFDELEQKDEVKILWIR